MPKKANSPKDMEHIAAIGAMDCVYFMHRWDTYKKQTDRVAGGNADGALLSEFDAMAESMMEEYKKEVDAGMAEMAHAQEMDDPQTLRATQLSRWHKSRHWGTVSTSKLKRCCPRHLVIFSWATLGQHPFLCML